MTHRVRSLWGLSQKYGAGYQEDSLGLGIPDSMSSG